MAKKDNAKLKAQLGIEFTGIEAEIKKLAPFMVKAGKALPMELRKGLRKVNQDINQIGELLERATDPETLTTLRQAMADVAKEAAKVGDGMSKAAVGSGKAFQVAQINKTTGALKQLNKTLKETQKAKRRTALMSQNMLRIMQDSPFGILGMANNIQMLGESLSHAMKKGDSFTTAMKAGLKDLFMGPMAFAMIITVATLILQKWDEIGIAADWLVGKIEGLSDAQLSLNAAASRFNTSKSWDKFIDTLNAKQVEQGTAALLAEKDALFELNKELGNIDIRAINNRSSALQGLFNLLGVVTGGVSAQGAGQAIVESSMGLGSRQLIEIERMLLKLEERQRKLMELPTKKRRLLIDTADDIREAALLKREETARIARLTAEAKSEVKSALMRLKGFDRRLEDAISAEEEQTKVELALVKSRNAAKLKLRREFIIAQRKMTAGLVAGIRLDDLKASAIGVGAIGRPEFDAGPSELVTFQEQKTARMNAANKTSIDARQKARAQLDIWMQLADANSDKEELDRLTLKHDAILAQEGVLTAAIKKNEQELARWKREQKAIEHQREMAALGAFAGEIGNLFGGMSTIMAKEGEKGLEQNKTMLKAQAWAQAISASIGIFNNVANTPGLGPFALAAAGAAMASTMVALAAQIRKIDNPSGAAGGAAVTGGAFVSLNSSVTAKRATAFQRSEDRRDSTGTQSAAASASNTERLLGDINDGIRTQKVVIDQPTIALIESQGKTINSRRVQTSN